MMELYRSEDAQQILQIAIARQAEAGELTRTQLYEIAAELNIAPADIQAAEQEWGVRRGESVERNAFDLQRRQRFQQRFAKFAIVNGFLITLNLLVGGGTWPIYILLGWGVGMALDAWKTFRLGGEDYEEAFLRWRQRRQLKKSVSTLVNRVLSLG
ncbi:MAG: 2TM domain-containing protein [Leptolyngbyaceae cyanobacterium CRU_2_3]|nr:2TM domain-containing protein [Leptolyngbyaceae cyanobacterium CRU_2_3]